MSIWKVRYVDNNQKAFLSEYFFHQAKDWVQDASVLSETETGI